MIFTISLKSSPLLYPCTLLVTIKSLTVKMFEFHLICIPMKKCSSPSQYGQIKSCTIKWSNDTAEVMCNC